MTLRTKLAVAAAGLTFASPLRAAGPEYCVRCSGPDKTYVCTLDGAMSNVAEGGSKLYCITALAQAGPHASCTIDRNAPTPCEGERKVLPVPAALDANDEEPDAPAGTNGMPAQANAPPIESKAQPAPQAPSSAPPQQGDGKPPGSMPVKPAYAPYKAPEQNAAGESHAVNDAPAKPANPAGEVANSAANAMEKAGTAVGDAAKSTWKCLSSLFSSC